MELEQFIAEDLVAFLDAQVRSGEAQAPSRARKSGILAPEELALYAPSRDYGKELDGLLVKKDFVQAKRLLREFKAEYDQYPDDSPERLEAKRLFKALYQTFQHARLREEEREQATLREDLKDVAPPTPPAENPAAKLFERRQEQPATGTPVPGARATEKPAAPAEQQPRKARAPADPAWTEEPKRGADNPILAVPDEKPETREPTPEPAPQPRAQNAPGFDDRINGIQNAIHAHDYPAAIAAYRAVRQELQGASLDKPARARYVAAMKALHGQLHEHLSHAPRHDTEAYRRAKEEVERHLDQRNLSAAMISYDQLKERFHELPSTEQLGEHATVAQLHTRIMKLRQERQRGTAPGVLDHAEKQLTSIP